MARIGDFVSATRFVGGIDGAMFGAGRVYGVLVKICTESCLVAIHTGVREIRCIGRPENLPIIPEHEIDPKTLKVYKKIRARLNL